MRTKKEIGLRWNATKGIDAHCFGAAEFMSYLDYDTIKGSFDPPLLREEYGKSNAPLDSSIARKRMVAYIAQTKQLIVDDRLRLIRRRFARFAALLWVDGDNIICQKLESRNSFGLEQLEEICRYLKIKLNEQEM